MDKKVQEFLDYAREDGISLQELLTGIVNIGDSYAFMTIKRRLSLVSRMVQMPILYMTSCYR